MDYMVYGPAEWSMMVYVVVGLLVITFLLIRSIFKGDD